MTPITFAIVGLRLLAIYCFVQSVEMFSSFAFVISISANNPLGLSQPVTVCLALLPGASLIVLGILLFVMAPLLGRHLAGPEAAGVMPGACTFEQVQSLVFAAAGIFILTLSLPAAARALETLITYFHLEKQGNGLGYGQISAHWINLVAVLAQIIVGLLLLLNPAAFRNGWRWLRTAAT